MARFPGERAEPTVGLVAPAHAHQGVAEAAGRLREVFSLVSQVRPWFPRQPSRQEQDMNTFTNKVVVTGGNSGMGLATAQEFSRRGAKVVISGRDEKTLAAAAASIGGETLAVRADVVRLSDLDDLFARTKKKFGSIDVLFVNAGIAKFAPFEQTTEAMHDEILDINFKGAFFTVQKALPLLKDGGAIVINTSVVTGKSMPNGSVYAASK